MMKEREGMKSPAAELRGTGGGGGGGGDVGGGRGG